MLKIYHVPQSRSFRTLWLAHELGVPFELTTLPFDLSVLRAPDYLAVNPLGRVPGMALDGAYVMESGAQAQLLTHRFPAAGLGRAPDHPEWPEWLQWIHYAETMAVHGAALVQQRVFIHEGQKSDAVRDLESKRLIKAMGVVERHMAGRTWLLDGGFSAADTCVGYSVHLGQGFVGFDRTPGLADYYQRCAARPAFQAALENKGFGE